MKKWMLLGTAACAVLSAGLIVSAAEYTPGVTVSEDPDSITGYTVTFAYEDAEAEQVQLRGAFTFFYDEEDVRGTTPEKYYTPEEWENGMFEAGDESLTIDMEKAEGTDLWVTSMPLPAGHYQYVFLVNGDADTKLEDPTNPMEASGVENGNHYDRSTFYVPYDAEKQSESMDWAYMAPIEEAGTVTYVNYTDVNGDAAPLGVYTPCGYDPEREEPYKVIYISHGGGGNETDWFAGGSVDYIFDNMIKDGTTEPVLLVAMNNTAYSWDFNVIVDNLVNCIIPYVEENYNVLAEPSGRAFTGLSMGGMTTTNVLFDVPELFDYVGILSGADVKYDTTDVDWDAVKATKIMLGAGIYDFGLIGEKSLTEEDGFTLASLAAKFDEQGVAYDWEEAFGSHDWNTWPQLIKVFAEQYLWK
ncbi:MAG: hypothetical protein IJ899_06155 [Blautia sp.]|nr:hypothetical protein [Blautia sp.]